MTNKCVITTAEAGTPARADVITPINPKAFAAFRDFTIRKLRAVQPGIILVIVLGVMVHAPSIYAKHPGTRPQSNPIAENLRHKLDQEVHFEPKTEAPWEQLIEVAKAFQIPMGVEWSEPSSCKPLSAVPNQITVEELLSTIVRRCPTQRLIVENGIVHIYSELTPSAQNILNFRIRRFQVKDQNLFIAEDKLRLAIDMQLHPEEYSEGYNGGTGFPPDDVFAVPNVTFAGKNVTVREVLDVIAKSNGNALWVVRLNAAALKPGMPLARRYKDWEAVVSIWRFIPLKDNPPTR